MIGDITILVRAEHDVAGGTDQYVLGSTEPDTAGAFELRGSLPANQAVTWNPDGSVRLEIEVHDRVTGASRYSILNAVPPVANGSWTAGSAPDPGLPRLDGSLPVPGSPITDLQLPTLGAPTPQQSQMAAASSTDPLWDSDGSDVDGAGDTYTEDVADSAVVAPEQACPNSNNLSWRDMDGKYDEIRYVPMHISWTRERTKNEFEWQSTTASQTSVAYKTGTNAYAAGLVYTREDTTSTGLVADAKKEAYRTNLLRMGWRYRKQKQICSYPAGHGGVQFDTGKRRFMPLRWTGDNRDVKVTLGFTCYSEYRIRIDNPLWVSRSTTVGFGGFFQLFGADMNSKQVRNSTHKVTYVLRNAYSTAYLCGDSADPTVSSSVKEVD